MVLWYLEERWNRVDLLEIFKIVKGITATHWSVFFHRAENKITRGHSWKLIKNHCHCNTRLQFFSQRVINRWNSLTEEDISVGKSDHSMLNIDCKLQIDTLIKVKKN